MPKQNKQAVVIGVNEYRDKQIPELFGAVNDATEVRRRLVEFGDFEVPDEHFLTNRRASAEAIRKAMSDIFWRPDPADLVLFYFSGHGLEDSYHNGYIAPYDMFSDEPYINGINMEELKKLVLRSLNKQCVVVILDCCFSGISTKGEKDIPDVSGAFDGYFQDVGQAGEGRIIIASSGEDQKSREIELPLLPGQDPLTHGIFTYHLITGMDGKAANDSGIITLDRLYNYVENQLAVSNQKPHFYAASTSQLEKIQIAIASQKFKSFIEGNLALAKENLQAATIWGLLFAIDNLGPVLEADPDNADALALSASIQTALDEYHDSVMQWLFDNDYGLKQKFFSVSVELARLASSMEFAKVSKMDKRGKSQLPYLCQVSRGEIEMSEFLNWCRTWSSPGVSNARGRAGGSPA